MTKEKNAETLDTLARAYFINRKKAEAMKTEKKDNLFMALTLKNLFYFHDDPAIVVIVERGTNIR